MSRSTRHEEGPAPSSRREMLKQTAVAGAVVAAAGIPAQAAAQEPASSERAVKNGRIKQSIVHWCFEKHWDVPQAIEIARRLGCLSIELIAPKYFPLLKQAGLSCAIGSIDMAPDPPFTKGFNNPKYRAQVLKATRDSIDACAEHGFKNVICFTGYREDIPDDVGAKNCVDGYKQVVGHAEKKGVTLCLEMLNSRVSTHPMKGHPGYQGDHTDYCIDIIKRVGSPHLKLLFDIYHVQIMDGDIISRLRHYQGHVGQEFIPTRDPLDGLRQAVALCDV